MIFGCVWKKANRGARKFAQQEAVIGPGALEQTANGKHRQSQRRRKGRVALLDRQLLPDKVAPRTQIPHSLLHIPHPRTRHNANWLPSCVLVFPPPRLTFHPSLINYDGTWIDNGGPSAPKNCRWAAIDKPRPEEGFLDDCSRLGSESGRDLIGIGVGQLMAPIPNEM